MSYYTKYRLDFYDDRGDYYKLLIIDRKGPYSEIINLRATDNPIIIEYHQEANDISQFITSSLKINLYTRRPLEFFDLYDAGELQYIVQLERNNDIFWLGFLTTDTRINYDCEPAEVTLTATDGLAYLKEIMFDDEGESYTGYQSAWWVINEILLKLEHISQYNYIREFVNVYERDMNSPADYSMLDQVYVNLDLFREKNCYYVLSEILKTFNATIFQKDGVFHIVRLADLWQDEFEGFEFDGDANESKISVENNILRIDRQGINVTGDFLGIENGTAEFLQPASEVKINFDYGNQQSWIKNYDFGADRFDYITSEIEEWMSSPASDVVINHISTIVKEEERGIALRRTSSANEPVISQYFASKCTATEDDFLVFEFDYGFYNMTSSDISNIQAQIMVLQKDKVLSRYDNEYYQWGTLGSSTLIMTDAVTVKPGWSGWTHFRARVPALNYDGEDYQLYIGLFCAWKTLVGNKSNVYACFRDLKFYATASEVQQKKKVRSIWQRLDFGTGDALINIRLRNKYYNVKVKQADENICEKNYIETTGIRGKNISTDRILGDVVDSTLYNRVEQFAGQMILSNNLATSEWIKKENINRYIRNALIRNSQNDNTLSSTEEMPIILLDKGYDADGYWYKIGQCPPYESMTNFVEEPEAWALWDMTVQPQPDTVSMKVTKVTYIGFDAMYGHIYKLWTYAQIAGSVQVLHRMALIRVNSKYVYIKNSIDFAKNTGSWNYTFTVGAAGIFKRHTDSKYCTIVSGYNSGSSVPRVKHHLFTATDPLGTWTDETGASSGDMFSGHYPPGYYGFNTITNCIPVPGEENYYVSAVGFFNSGGSIVAFGVLKYNDTFTDITSWVLDRDYTPTIGYLYFYSINYCQGKWYYSIHDGTGNTGRRIVLVSNSLDGTYTYHSTVFDFAEMKDLSMQKNAVGYGGLQVIDDTLYFTASGEGYNSYSGNYRNHEIFLFKYIEAEKIWIPVSYPFFNAKHGTGFGFPSWAYDHGGGLSSFYEENDKLYFVYAMCAGKDTYQATTGWMMKSFLIDNYYEINRLVAKELAVQTNRHRICLNIPFLLREGDTLPSCLNAILDPACVNEVQTNIRLTSLWTLTDVTLEDYIDTNDAHYIKVQLVNSDDGSFEIDTEFEGRKNKKLYIRYKSDYAIQSFKVYWQTDYHEISEDYVRQYYMSMIADGNWHVLECDMSDNEDWIDNVVRKLRFYVNLGHNNYMLIDYIGLDRLFLINQLEYSVKKRNGNIRLIELIKD